MQQQNALIGAAIAAYYPEVTLSALYGFAGNPISSLIPRPTRCGRSARAAARRCSTAGCAPPRWPPARALYDQAVANYRQTVLTAFQQVEDELAALRILESASCAT